MSRRSLMMDDKIISEMILKNVQATSYMNIDMNEIFNQEQMWLMNTYKETYNYQPYLTFFLSLGVLSHLSQSSFYTHYSSPDRNPTQLYLWLLGSSGIFTCFMI